MGKSRKLRKRPVTVADILAMYERLEPPAQEIARRLIDVLLAERSVGRTDLLEHIERHQSRARSRGGYGLTEADPVIRRAEARISRH